MTAVLSESQMPMGTATVQPNWRALSDGPTVAFGRVTPERRRERSRVHEHRDVLVHVVRAMVQALDAKDEYTCGHSDRVARFAVRIALQMQCSPHQLQTVYLAGLVHDIGKIGIDDQVLRKPGRLTEAEYEHIRSHVDRGHRMLSGIPALEELLPGVLHHHEQWNGEGYPRRLAGEEIPEIARILAVADALDAMTSDRPYRAGMPMEKANQILLEGAGSQWDPTVVVAYAAVKEDLAAIASDDRAKRAARDTGNNS